MTTLNWTNTGFQSAKITKATFTDYLRAGFTAFEKGEREAAHEAWREAAEMDPYREEVWQALLNVVENPEDRIVCLKNIIAINPVQAEAREALRILETREEKLATQEIKRMAISATQTKRKRRTVFQSLLIGAVIAFAGIAIAIGINLFLYLR